MDLILLDIMMAGMDGYTFLRTLRGDHHGRDVPVVVVTAVSAAEVSAKVQGLGVRCVVPKGPDLHTRLRDAVKRVLGTPEHPYHVELPEPGSIVRPFLDVYLKMLARS